MPARQLRIDFSRGARPHRFWVSDSRPSSAGFARYAVLSRRVRDARLEVPVIEERAGGARRPLEQAVLDPDSCRGER